MIPIAYLVTIYKQGFKRGIKNQANIKVDSNRYNETRNSFVSMEQWCEGNDVAALECRYGRKTRFLIITHNGDDEVYYVYILLYR